MPICLEMCQVVNTPVIDLVVALLELQMLTPRSFQKMLQLEKGDFLKMKALCLFG
jgi:hypothetical protein